MRIIDAHAHIFEHLHGFGWRGEMRATGDGAGIWANGERMQVIPPEYGGTCFSAEMLLELLSRHGVEKAVLLQGSLYGFANDYVSQMMGKYPNQLVGAGSYDPYCLDADNILARLTGELGYRIIKLEFSSYGGFMGYHDGFRLNSPRMLPLWERAARMDLAIVLDMGSAGDRSYQVEDIAAVAEGIPHVPIVVTHLGAPRQGDEKDFAAMLEALSPIGNISFDLSALLWNTSPENPPYPTATRYLSLARDSVGAERLLWGSDTPCVLTRFSYSELLRHVMECGVFAPGELEDVLYNNAQRVYFERYQ